MKKFMYDVLNTETNEVMRANVETGELNDDWTVEAVEEFFWSCPYEKVVRNLIAFPARPGNAGRKENI